MDQSNVLLQQLRKTQTYAKHKLTQNINLRQTQTYVKYKLTQNTNLHKI